MKKFVIRLSLYVMLFVLMHLGALAQTTTVTVREAYKTSYGTTYWINTHPATTIPTINTSRTTVIKGNSLKLLPVQVKGDAGYEIDLNTTVALFNKADKTPDEYQKLNQCAYIWETIYKRPKDARLRKFYRFHGLHDIFGDKEATLLEHY